MNIFKKKTTPKGIKKLKTLSHCFSEILFSGVFFSSSLEKSRGLVLISVG